MSAGRRTTGFVLGGLLLTLLLAGVVSNFAASSPDGLDAASTRGCTLDSRGEITGGTCIAQGARDHEFDDSPFADYGVRGVGNGYLSTGLAGASGVLLTFAIAGGLCWLARRRQGAAPPPAASAVGTASATSIPTAPPAATVPAAETATRQGTAAPAPRRR